MLQATGNSHEGGVNEGLLISEKIFILSEVKAAATPPIPREMTQEIRYGMNFFNVFSPLFEVYGFFTPFIHNIFERSNMEKEKDEEKTVIPTGETNPIRLGEKCSESAEDLAIKLAREWVEKNKL